MVVFALGAGGGGGVDPPLLCTGTKEIGAITPFWLPKVLELTIFISTKSQPCAI